MPFTGVVAKKIIKYIFDKYGARPEFLWTKFPNNAIFRDALSNKWFAALLIIPARKIGLDSDDNIEILDVKSEPAMIASIIDNEKFFPAYHMNKEHWITVMLDGSVSDKNIFALLDISFGITDK